MKSGRSKIVLTLTALFLMLTIAASLAFPIVNAHTPAWNIPTYAYVAVSPTTVGVGQYVQILMWISVVPPTAQGLEGDRWHGFKLDITKPDGTKETLGPFDSGATGNTWTTYTPDQVGAYTIVFSWPGQVAGNGTGVPNSGGLVYVGDYYKPATSDPLTLPVTQNPIVGWQEPPLPTSFWKRPINVANREWSTLASNWLGGSWLVGNWQRAGKAPNSSHILWQKPIGAGSPGGIVDAQWPSMPPNVDDYESFFSSPIIMNGRIYYNTPQVASTQHYGYYCFDLYTGERIWYSNNTFNMVLGAGPPALTQTFPTLSFGQLYHYYSTNGQGVLSYLWMTQGNTWYMLDAETGNLILTLKNVPGGTAVTDQDGSLLRFSYNSATGNVLCWNSSQSIPPLSPGIGTSGQQWKPRLGATIDAVNDTSWTAFGAGPTDPWTLADVAPRSGYTMNCTGPKGLPGSITAVLRDANRVPRVILGSRTNAMGLGGSVGGGGAETFSAWALSISYGTGTYTRTNLGYSVNLLWSRDYAAPVTGNQTMIVIPGTYDDGVWLVNAKESRQWWGYSLTDGSQLWGPTSPGNAWEMYGSVYRGSVAYSRLYEGQFGGVLRCFDIKTGKLLWNYTAKATGWESPYGNNPIAFSGAIAFADGKVYFGCTEHSPTKPLERGFYLYCLDAYSGQELWKIQNYYYGLSIADGYLVAGNEYDNMVYCYGKGPTATTISASPKVSVNGDGVLIEGTVTDQSPGAKDTPAIAEESMQAWMEYLYMQQAMPTDAKGVEVSLDTLDPNGNFIHIGTATSDASGMFKKLWTPEVPGEYTVIATFGGSKSYYSSYAETAIGVEEAPPATSPPEYPQPIDPTLTIVGTGIVLLIAIAIVGILLLRKK